MNPLDLLETPLRGVLDFLHGTIGFTYGWAIVMLTVLVRLILLPLFVKQYKSARRMQEVAPQMKALQQKYKGNKKKLQEEMMRFYKENDVNPFGSCLPLVAQAPVFIALYYTLRSTNFQDRSDLSFMGVIPDISKHLTEIGWAVIPLVLIYAVSQLISSELSATASMSKNQRWLMRVLPLGIVFFVFQFPVPAGLVIYWATTNLWTCGQQLVLKRRIEAELEAVPAGAGVSGGRSRADGDGMIAVVEAAAVPEEGDVIEASAGAAAVTPRSVPRRRSGRTQPKPPSAAASDQAGRPDAHEVSGPDAEPTPPAAPGQKKARRQPQARKTLPGGPSRPATRKPPKRRK